jgi:hypothetical protein
MECEKMNNESIIKGIKEKGPTLLLGALIGAAIVGAYVNRAKIAKTVEAALKRKPQGENSHEHSAGN